MAIVYTHKRLDTGEVFYVGIGKSEKRAHSSKRRGKFWNDFTKNHSYTVEITHRDIIWEEACSIERYLISFYGRRDLGEGCLVNMTDGGDGCDRRIVKPTDSFREKCRANMKGKTWEERFGPERAAELKANMAKRQREKGTLTKYVLENGAPCKGKTLGPQTDERKNRASVSLKQSWINRTDESKDRQLSGIRKKNSNNNHN